MFRFCTSSRLQNKQKNTEQFFLHFLEKTSAEFCSNSRIDRQLIAARKTEQAYGNSMHLLIEFFSKSVSYKKYFSTSVAFRIQCLGYIT